MTTVQITDSPHLRESEAELIKITSPLFDSTDIRFFLHGRIYADNSFFSLTTNLAYHKAAMAKGIQILPEIPQEIQQPHFHIIPNQTSGRYKETIQHCSQLFDLDHPIYFLRNYTHYTDVFIFGSHAKSKGMKNFYLNNLDTLERFILFYLSTSKELINNHKKQLLFMPNSMLPENFKAMTRMIENNNQRKTHLNTHFQLKHYILHDKEGNDIKVSHREIACLEQILYGKTSKQIGDTLYL